MLTTESYHNDFQGNHTLSKKEINKWKKKENWKRIKYELGEKLTAYLMSPAKWKPTDNATVYRSSSIAMELLKDKWIQINTNSKTSTPNPV